MRPIFFFALVLGNSCVPKVADAPPLGDVPVVDPLAGSTVPGRLLVHAPTECVEALQTQLAAGWEATPLFGTSVDEGQTTWNDEGSSPEPLRQFCVVSRPCDVDQTCDPSVPALDEGALQSSLGTAYSVGLDHRALNSAADLNGAAAPWLAQRADQEMRVATPPTGSGSVELVVVDTQPDTAAGEVFPGSAQPGVSAHGFVLASLAHHLVCPGGTCGRVAVRTRLALNLVNGDGDDTNMEVGGNGGSFGTFSGLAQAIRAETRRWVASGGTSRLVMNLSLGWNPIFGGASADLEPDLYAVQLALRDAQCRGVLIFAAAGNATGGPESLGALSGRNGPYYPAAWQGRTPPGKCAPFIAGSPIGTADLSDERLLYAVGGVDDEGWDLGISRPQARPHLLAFADHLVLMDGSTPISAPMTGTSVGTVVVSSAAAFNWVNSPSSSPGAIVKALYGAANKAPDRAVPTNNRQVTGPFVGSMGTGVNDARIVDMCSAGTGCASLGTLPDLNLTGVVFTPGTTGTPYGSGAPSMASCTVDSVPTILNGQPVPNATQDLLCPYLHYYSPEVRPFVGPQPNPWGCPLCVLDKANGQFRGNIDGTNHEDYSNHVVTVTRSNPPGGPEAYSVTITDPSQDFVIALGCSSGGYPLSATLTSSGPGGSGVGSVAIVGTGTCP